MAFMTVDFKKCVKDYLCVADCPMELIKKKENGYPESIEGADELCISCGHCVAICLAGALSLEKVPVEQCVPLPGEWRKDVDFVLRGRRSIRNFKDKVVDKVVIEELIDTARYAPSGINRQPVRWIIIYDPKIVHDIAGEVINWQRKMIADNSPLAASLRFDRLVEAWDKGKDRICRGAPRLVLAYALKDDMTAPQACTIAAAYLEIAAVTKGLGTCWAGYLNMAVNMWPPAQELAGMNKRCACYAALMLGWPKFEYKRIPLRNKANIAWR
jgi:nitroreductase/NAD-dependent dihydropyrimidine dehydrogenase PreA subunit